MKPPQFHGGLDPLKAEAWVLGIEQLFEVFPFLETQKVLLAIFILKDEARRKVSEFMELKQNNMSVAEYEAKFTELARFPPHMFDTDYKKARHFEGGLRDDILEKVNVLKLDTYIEVLNRAIISEANIARQTKSLTDWKRHMARDCNQNSGKLAASSTASILKPGNTTRPITIGDTVSIPIVSEFPDVFSDELLGELVNREIEFTIDIMLGTQPISKTSYRMATTEIKELKE
ncbi:uncharacterized protein LOC114290687 [Camellia sinensis]|uniref:uncharacterized protein LOC114290687 n=1 Tax=Camellia sinensis TaxID=4442 RepID=UPI0010363A46|nr:uncharacterized protein LOC114290687 [Camellia sinensis]